MIYFLICKLFDLCPIINKLLIEKNKTRVTRSKIKKSERAIFLQTSGYYIKMLICSTLLDFCLLTYTLFSNVFDYKERQHNEYIV